MKRDFETRIAAHEPGCGNCLFMVHDATRLRITGNCGYVIAMFPILNTHWL